MRLPSQILGQAMWHGKQRIGVTPEEFERVKAFRQAHFPAGDPRLNDQAKTLTLQNGSVIYIQQGA